MLQEEGNRILANFFKTALKKLTKYSVKFSIAGGKKIKTETENHKKKNIKALIKKYPDTGIHIEENIQPEHLKKMEEVLQKLKIDYVVEPNQDNKNKFDIMVPVHHKQTVEYLNKKLKAPAKGTESLKSRIERARTVANNHNRKIAQQKKQANVLGQNSIKHKSPTH